MRLEVLFKIGLNNGKKRMQVPSGYEYLATTKSTGSRESMPSRCHISEHYLRCSLQYLGVLQQIFILYHNDNRSFHLAHPELLFTPLCSL